MKQVAHGSNLGVYEADASEDHILVGPVRGISQREDGRVEMRADPPRSEAAQAAAPVSLIVTELLS